MIEAYAAADVRAAEEPVLAAERVFAGGLMDRAAAALAGVVREELRVLPGARGRRSVAGRDVVALVGAGNNGGDALHALARLRREGVRTTALLLSDHFHEGGLAAHGAAGGRAVAVTDEALGDAAAEAFAADVLLDGLLGIGGRGALRGTAARLVEVLTGLVGEGRPGRERPVVVAVDLPSGTGVDDGTVPGPVLPADRTVAFGVLTPGLLLPPAALVTGRVDVVDLGLAPRSPALRRLEPADVARLWPVPGRAAHKYSRGVVGVVAGSPAYPGAAVLTCGAALAAGCGMVRYVGPDQVARAVLGAHPEVVVGDGRVQALVLGPGTGADGGSGPAVAEALRRAADGVPAVVDAGALAAVPGAGRLPDHVVLTPHAGELARLLDALGTPVERRDVEAEPLRWARAAHDATGATVLLKGPITVVVGAGGVLSQADAPAWLATAGAGDVLAGVLGAVLAGRHDDLLAGRVDAASLAATAALVHGRAAHAACPGGPVTATGVTVAVPGVVAGLLAEAEERC